MSAEKKAKLGIVVTIGGALDVLFPDFYPLAEKKGLEVVGICSHDQFVENVRRQGVRVIEVPMTRTFTPFCDFICLIKLIRIFRAEQFELIHYSTPKAALLSAIAGRFCPKSKKLYTLRGLAYQGFSGFQHFIAKTCEKIACRGADSVIGISQSIAKEAIKENLVSEEHIRVLGAGSSKGVNVELFTLNSDVHARAAEIRSSLGIQENDIVVGYVGRLTHEKGLHELLDAFGKLSHEHNNLHLLFVGPQDDRVPLSDEHMSKLQLHDHIHLVGFQFFLPPYYAAMDIFAFPTYREGFGNVLIEASAMGVPVIASDISGCRDAVKNGVTGLLVKVQDSESLTSALRRLIQDESLRKEFGCNGREWVRNNFNRIQVWEKLLKVYEEMVTEGRPFTAGLPAEKK